MMSVNPLDSPTAFILLALTEVVNELTDTATKVGTLGGQSLIALMLLALGAWHYYSEKERKAERKAAEERSVVERLNADRRLGEQYTNLSQHHAQFIEIAEKERTDFHLAIKSSYADVRGLTERSIVAMHAMATSTDALREFLGARRLGESREHHERRAIANEHTNEP